MIGTRASASTSHAHTLTGRNEVRAEATPQDDRGPLDGELLDLYVAILIVVPFACLLRSLWS